MQKLFLTFRTIFVHNMFSPCSAKRRASDRDLPVPIRRLKVGILKWLIPLAAHAFEEWVWLIKLLVQAENYVSEGVI